MRTFKKFFLLLAMSLLISPGLASAQEMTLANILEKTKFKDDPGDGVLEFKGPEINSFGEDPYYLMVFTNPEFFPRVYILVVEYDFIKAKGSGDGSIVQTADSLYKGFYEAVDEKGQTFRLEVFHKDFDGCGDNAFCSFEEYFRIFIPDEYILDHAQIGTTLYAKTEAGPSYKIELPANYLGGIVLKIHEEMKKRGLN